MYKDNTKTIQALGGFLFKYITLKRQCDANINNKFI